MAVELPQPEGSTLPEVPTEKELQETANLRSYLKSLKRSIESDQQGLFNNDRAIADTADALVATSTSYVLLTSDQTISGTKTFGVTPILPVALPTTNPQAANKVYVDTTIAARFETATGHAHDGTDSKKVIATNLDMSGLTSNYLYNSAGTLIATAVPTPYYTLVGSASVNNGTSMSVSGITAGTAYRAYVSLVSAILQCRPVATFGNHTLFSGPNTVSNNKMDLSYIVGTTQMNTGACLYSVVDFKSLANHDTRVGVSYVSVWDITSNGGNAVFLSTAGMAYSGVMSAFSVFTIDQTFSGEIAVYAIK